MAPEPSGQPAAAQPSPVPAGAADPNAARRLEPARTSHVLATDQGDVHYLATAGYLDLTLENIGGDLAAEPTTKARVFLTEYTVPPPGAAPSAQSPNAAANV
ncbi:MAG: hypothetical protein LBG60_02775, partial [Bifidobacteriaceae bacterium]|nr:hypothetical protein [Bifidobacteriaceae bacterium]